MELRQLKCFLTVCEELNFSRAAERWFVSQSAISLQIAKLEREIGQPLLTRSSRKVLVTDLGQELIPLAQKMIGLEDAALKLAAPRPKRLRLAANMTFSANALAAIALLRQSNPALEIDFVIKGFAERVDAVAAGDCDIALIRGDVQRHNIYTEKLWTEDLMVVTSSRHPLAVSGAPSIHQLMDYPLLLPRRSSQVLIHEMVERVAKDAGIHFSFGRPVASDHTVVADLLNQPDAWSIMFANTVDAAEQAGLHTGLAAGRRFVVDVRAACKADAPASQELRELIDALIAAPLS